MNSPEKQKILVVEDDRSLAEAVRLKLGHSGFETCVAGTVEDAIEALRVNDDIVAVWLDHYLLGSENGLDFVTRVKIEGSPWKHLPIIVVSNTASAEKVQAYLLLGVDEYYVKAEHRLEEIIDSLRGSINRAKLYT